MQHLLNLQMLELMRANVLDRQTEFFWQTWISYDLCFYPKLCWDLCHAVRENNVFWFSPAQFISHLSALCSLLRSAVTELLFIPASWRIGQVHHGSSSAVWQIQYMKTERSSWRPAATRQARPLLMGFGQPLGWRDSESFRSEEEAALSAPLRPGTLRTRWASRCHSPPSSCWSWCWDSAATWLCWCSIAPNPI